MEQTAESWASEEVAVATDLRGASNSTMLLDDGQDGRLTLDLKCSDLRWLVAACRSLLAGRVPPGASMLKVRAGDEVYVLIRQCDADGSDAVRITNLYNQSETVLLPHDLAELIMAVLDRLIAR